MLAAKEAQLTAGDGTPLFVIDWEHEALRERRVAKRGVLLMHGLGEHSGRYARVVQFFCEAGWFVRSYDHRGHGRSGGPRGDVPDDETVLRDARLVLDDFSRSLDAPPLLLGHSMGGLYAARLVTGQTGPVCGLILSSPALGIPLSPPQKLLLKVLRTVAPGLALPNGLDIRYLSHDGNVIRAYENDPLVHRKITPRLLCSMLDAAAFAKDHASSVTVPTLMLVAGDDHMVDPAGSKRFHARLNPGIGTFHYYDGYYHEVFNEAGAQRVFDDMQAWLNAQAFPAGRSAGSAIAP